MIRGIAVAAIGSGCVLELPLEDDGNDAILECIPGVVTPGETSLHDIFVDHGRFDFDDVIDVRSIGDVRVIEWTTRFESLQLVLDAPPQAQGEQVIALDTARSTAFVSVAVARQ